MEIHRELGKWLHDEVIYKDALVVELNRAGIPLSREKNYEITYKELSCLTIIALILLSGRRFSFEAKAVEKLTDSHPQTSVELSWLPRNFASGC